MGKLRNYTVSRRAVPTRAPEKRATSAPSKSKRTLGLALVAVVGVAAGGGLGAALYHFDRDAKPDFLAASKTNSDAFAAAAEAVFDTSPVKDKTSDLKLNAVTNDAQRVPTGSVTASSENGLTWTADESAKKDLPNVVVISSKAPVQKAAEPPATKIASLVPVTVFKRQATDTPQSLSPVGTEPLAYNPPQQAFDKKPEPAVAAPEPAIAEPLPASAEAVPARLLKQRIEARMRSTAASSMSDTTPQKVASLADTSAVEDPLTIAGTRHFIALPETVESVEEAVALQDGWKTTANAHVNLRAKPTNRGEVLMVIPAKAEVLVMKNCRRWCAIMYEGRKGYVHRSFVSQTRKPKVTVEVAETEAEVIALETRMAAKGTNQFFAPAQSTAAFAAQQAADEGYRKAYATKYVNLRVAPKKDAEILTVVPNDSEFMVEPVCKHWCGVVYKGQKGYIYRTYFQFTGKES